MCGAAHFGTDLLGLTPATQKQSTCSKQVAYISSVKKWKKQASLEEEVCNNKRSAE